MSGYVKYATLMERVTTELLVGLAACLCDALKEAAAKTGAPEPCFCGVLPGTAVAQDYCDEGYCEANNGMAWTRLVSITTEQVQTSPSGASGPSCATVYNITVEAGVLRSAPVFSDSEGEPPTVEAQLAASMQQQHDMGVVLSVLDCCDGLPEMLDRPIIGEYLPIGPEGGCVGGAWSATWSVV